MIRYTHNINGRPYFLKVLMEPMEKKAHSAWHAMIQRCTSPSSGSFKNYGAKGITVCARWLEPIVGFLAFVEDIGLPASTELSLDRKDSTKGYDKENCQWANDEVKHANRKNTVWIEYQGKKYTTTAFSKISGVSISTLLKRVEYGKTGDDLMLPTNYNIVYYDVGDGRKLKIVDIAREVGCSATCIQLRINRGVTGADLLKPSKKHKYNALKNQSVAAK